MDCLRARKLLDAGRPDRSDWDAPELDAAAQHLEGCAECQTVLAERGQWDARLSEAMAAVAVPVGLADRLLAAVDAPSTSATSPLVPTTPSRRGRRWAVWSAAAAALVAIGVLSWRMRPGEPASSTLADLYQHVDQQLIDVASTDSLLPFTGDFEPLPGDSVWREAVAGASPAGLELDGRPGSDAAAYRFASGRLAGWLIVLPREQVQNPPAESMPVHANFQYGAHPRVAWTAGEQVYVCVLDTGNSLDDLRRAFYGAAA